MLCKIITADEIPYEIEIGTFEEFEKTLDQLTTYPPSNESVISVELPSGSMLSLNLSCPKTFLSYVGYNELKEFTVGLISVGDLSDDSGEVINCYWDYFGESWIRRLKRHLISQKQARMALHYFIQTNGQLTDEIIWENPIPWNKYLEIYDIFDDLMSEEIISAHHSTENEPFQQNEKAPILIGLLENQLGKLESKVETHIEKLEVKTLDTYIWLLKRFDEKWSSGNFKSLR